jgi:hypothetical protein
MSAFTNNPLSALYTSIRNRVKVLTSPVPKPSTSHEYWLNALRRRFRAPERKNGPKELSRRVGQLSYKNNVWAQYFATKGVGYEID